MRTQRAGLDPLVRWLASSDRKRAALSLTVETISGGATRSGNKTDDAGLAVQAGRALVKIDDASEWGGLDYLAADAFVAEDRIVSIRLKDTKDDFTPGVETLFHRDSYLGEGNRVKVRYAKPNEGVLARANKVGPGFENEHVFFRTKLVSHHRSVRGNTPPENSTKVADPGDGDDDDWEAGLHGLCRVRPWVEQFCQGATAATPNDRPARKQPYAMLLNFTKSSGDLSGYGAAHFKRGEALLSDEAGGFAAAADDGQHDIAASRLARIMQGGLNISKTLHGDREAGIIYSPAEFVNQQWIPGVRGGYPLGVEWREDFNFRHTNHCGRKVPGLKRWMSWQVMQPKIPVPILPPEDPPPGDPPPPGGPPKIPVPILPPDNPVTGDPPGAILPPGGGAGGEPWEPPPSYEEGEDEPEHESAGGGGGAASSGQEEQDVPWEDPWAGWPGDHPPSHALPPLPTEEDGEPSAESPDQLEAPSFSLHPRPALPEGRLQPRLLGDDEGPRGEMDAAWGLRYGHTHEQYARQPLVGDEVAAPEYLYDTPRQSDDPAERWPTVKSTGEKLILDVFGLIVGQKPARGPGGKVAIPSNMSVAGIFVENKNRLRGQINNFTSIIAAGKNAAGVEIPGRGGIGLRTIKSGRVASGWEYSLDYSGPGGIAEPDLHWHSKTALGANGGAGRFFVNGVELGAGGGTGDVTALGGTSWAAANRLMISGGANKTITDTGIAATVGGDMLVPGVFETGAHRLRQVEVIDATDTGWTLDDNDDALFVDTAGGDVDVLLPASPKDGDEFTVKNIGALGEGAVNVDPNGDTLDGLADVRVLSPGVAETYLYEGSAGWQTI